MTEDFDSRLLEGLEYVPSLGERVRLMAQSWFELGLYGLAAAAVSLAAWSTLTTPDPGGLFHWGAIVFAATLFLALGVFVRVALLRRPVLVRKGRLRLNFPARRPDGRRVRFVSLFEIVEVAPSFGLSGEDGLNVTLADSTGFFLARRSFGRQGLEIMERLCAVFQRSFRQEMQRLVQDGYLVATLKVKKRKGDVILLAVPVLTYSGERKTRLHPMDVTRLQLIETRMSGKIYGVEFADGTPMLLSEEDVDRLRIRSASAWAAKIPGE